MIIAPLALVVCVVGLVLWLLPVSGKVNEIGKIMFAVGLVVVILIAGGHGGLRLG